jgi:hypothetical protein
MLQGAAHAGAVDDPVLVPANTTWQVEGVQEIGLPPLFLTETETAVGDAAAEAPALVAAPTTTMLALDVALVTRLYTEVVTIPPTPRTAAMMMKRSMLWEIAARLPWIFIAQLPLLSI